MAKVPYRKGQRRCIFCDATGVTKEHMWPDWLKSYIPRTADKHSEGRTLVHLDRDESSISSRTGDPHSRRIKCVCQACNNGWMSRLQTAAKPYLVPMLRGEETSIHRRGQTLLSAWVAMTVMVAEHVQQDMIAIPQLDRNYLRNHEEAPKHWRIWIGRHARKNHPLFSHRSLTFVGSKEELERLKGMGSQIASNTQTTTICLGEHILIHVMSSEVASSIVRRWKFPNQVAANLRRIWPIRDKIVFWPPSQIFSDDGIAFLADDFSDKAANLAKSLRGSGIN